MFVLFAGQLGDEQSITIYSSFFGPSLLAGWFARDASLLRAIGCALLPNLQTSNKRVQRVILAEDLFNLSTAPKEPVIAALTGTLAKVNSGESISSPVGLDTNGDRVFCLFSLF